MSIFAELEEGILTVDPGGTEKVGQRLASALPPDCALALAGDLGAGKTTFVRGMARAWGITSLVSSPTFTVFTLHQGRRQLVHLDAFRLRPNDWEAWDALMVEDFLQTPWCLAVEWPERVAPFLPPDTRWIRFQSDPAYPDHRVLRWIPSP